MYDERAGSWLRAQPASDDLVDDPDRAGSASTVLGPLAHAHQGTMRHAHSRDRERSAQLDSQAGSPRVVSAGAVNEQDIGQLRQSSNRILHHLTDP
jgi:hypothetical protein